MYLILFYKWTCDAEFLNISFRILQQGRTLARAVTAEHQRLGSL